MATATVAAPYTGTVFIDADWVTADDPTALRGLSDEGTGNRTMFDRRHDAFRNYDAYLFQATFADGLSAEIQVNPEFGSLSAARAEAQKYAVEIGRLPTLLRMDVDTVWIHRGNEAFGGGNRNLLIHTDQGEDYIASGFLNEVFVHEAVHTSLDADHASSAGWLAAQAADPMFLSTYARDNPTREDVAESFLPYYALRLFPDRVSAVDRQQIEDAIPNRIAYFDSQNFELTTVAAVPEPTTSAMLVMIAGGLAARHRRKRSVLRQ